jgi:hypothetical protein
MPDELDAAHDAVLRASAFQAELDAAGLGRRPALELRRPKHTPSQLCDCVSPEYIHHCDANLPEAINAVARWVARHFGDADGFMPLSKREGYAYDLFAELAHDGLAISVLSKRKGISLVCPTCDGWLDLITTPCPDGKAGCAVLHRRARCPRCDGAPTDTPPNSQPA